MTIEWDNGLIPRADPLQWSFIGLRHTEKAWGKFGRVVERWECNGDVQVVAEYVNTDDVIEFTRRLRPVVDGAIFLHDWKRLELPVAELMRDHIPPRKQSPRYDHTYLLKELEENGLQWPIVASESGGRVIGSNRLRAAHKLGWKTISCYVVPLSARQMRGM